MVQAKAFMKVNLKLSNHLKIKDTFLLSQLYLLLWILEMSISFREEK